MNSILFKEKHMLNYKTRFYQPEKKLIIPFFIYQKILAFTKSAEGEISGFGKTEELNGDIVVKEFEIFKQKCNPVHTTLDKEALTMMYVTAAQRGEDPSLWNFWWHSHVDMTTGFSAEDIATLKRVSADGGNIIALCTNKDQEYAATQFVNGVCTNDKFKVTVDFPEELMLSIGQEIKEKVTYDDFADRKKFQTVSKYDVEEDDSIIGREHKRFHNFFISEERGFD